jgi:hypothetical protein
MKVYLDDLRPAPEGWVLVRSYRAAIDLLRSGHVTEISLDNDLGSIREGYDVVTWIEQMVYQTSFRPPTIIIHSSNTVARNKMEAGIRSIKRGVDDQARRKQDDEKAAADYLKGRGLGQNAHW